MTSENMDHFFQYLRRALHACLWCYLFYYVFIQHTIWIDNPQKFLVLYIAFLLSGTIGQMILGYVFQERNPKTYIWPTLRKTQYYVVIGAILYFSGYMVPYFSLAH